jgi:hypothetical protein
MNKKYFIVLICILLAGIFYIFIQGAKIEGQVVEKNQEEKCPKTNGYIWCVEKGKCIKFS